MLLREFITTVFTLVVSGRFKELRDYLHLIRELLTVPTAVITVGKPIEKE
jgi:hypothetical protein